MPEETLKLCVDCKHCEMVSYAPMISKRYCTRFTRTNPVTGLGKQRDIECWAARNDQGHCTYDGIHWEAKEG